MNEKSTVNNILRYIEFFHGFNNLKGLTLEKFSLYMRKYL